MSTYGGKRAYSINLLGGYRKLDFEFGENTEVYFSCSLEWKNQHYVFGGSNDKQGRQISMVNHNRLERKGSLDFDFNIGGCSVLNQQTILLCFDDSERDLCRQSNNPLGSFTKLPNSHYDHCHIRIAAFDGENTILLYG